MDKRSLMAIALTFVILVGWQAFYAAPQQKKLAAKRVAELREKERADSLAALERGGCRGGNARRVGPGRHDARGAGRIAGERGRVPSSRRRDGRRGENNGRDRQDDGCALERRRGGRERHLRQLQTERRELGRARSRRGGGRARARPSAERRMEEALRARVRGARRRRAGRRQRPRRARRGARKRRSFSNARGLRASTSRSGSPFSRGGYVVGVAIALKREGAMANSGAYSIGWESGLATSETNVKLEQTKFAALGMVGEEFYQVPLAKFSKETRRAYDGTVVWAGARTKYFLSALVATKGKQGLRARSSSSASGPRAMWDTRSHIRSGAIRARSRIRSRGISDRST